MARGEATIRVNVTADNKKLTSTLKDSEGKLKKFGKNVGKATLAAGALAAGALIVISKASVKAASDAQQSIGATETVFGKFAGTVIKTSNQAADSVGLSANAYRENANLIGSLLGNQGVAQDKLAAKTKAMIGTASDLAATFGGTTSDAVEALTSAFKGEFDPLEKYGISIKQSTVNTEAYRIAGVKTKAAFDKLTVAQQNQAKQQATTNLITKQSSKTLGAFGKESDTLAHQQQVMSSRFEDLKATIGTALTPALTTMGAQINKNVLPPLQKLAEKYAPMIGSALQDAAKKAGPFLHDLLSGDVSISGETTKSLGDIAESAKTLAPALKDAGDNLPSFSDGLKVFNVLIGFAADHVDTLAKVLPILVGAFVAYKGVQLVNQAIGKDSLIGFALQLTATRQLTKANKELAGAVREVNSASKGSAGPLGGLSGSADTATKKMGKFKTAAAGAAGIAGMGLMIDAAGQTNESLGLIEGAVGGAMSGAALGAFAGPEGALIGGAIGGLGGLLSGLVTHTKDAGQAAKDSIADWSGLAGTLDTVTGKTTEATRAFIYDTLQRKGVIDALAKEGISGRTAVGAILGEKDARAELNEAIRQTTARYESNLAKLNELKAARRDAAKVGDTTRISALTKQIDPLQKVVDAEKKWLDSVNAGTNAVTQQTKAVRKRSKAVTDYKERLKGLPRAAITRVEAKGLPNTVKGIARLAKRYKLTPAQIKTLIKVTGVETSVKSVEKVKKKLRSVGDAKPSLTPFQTGMKNKLHAMTQERSTSGAGLAVALKKETRKARADLDPFKASFTRGVNKTKKSAHSGGKEVGASLKSGVLAGVGGMGSALSAAVSGAVHAAIAAGKKAADAHSPSKKMYDLGKDMTSGIVTALDSSHAELAAAGANASKAAMGGMASGAATQYGGTGRLRAVSRAPSGGVAAVAAPAAQIMPKQTPVTVMLDGAVIADRLDLRRSLAAAESVRRTA